MWTLEKRRNSENVKCQNLVGVKSRKSRRRLKKVTHRIKKYKIKS